jgi:hypothetical protein
MHCLPGLVTECGSMTVLKPQQSQNNDDDMKGVKMCLSKQRYWVLAVGLLITEKYSAAVLDTVMVLCE